MFEFLTDFFIFVNIYQRSLTLKFQPHGRGIIMVANIGAIVSGGILVVVLGLISFVAYKAFTGKKKGALTKMFRKHPEKWDTRRVGRFD
jgi:hypothetical protein